MILEQVVDHSKTVCDATGVNLTLRKQVGSWGGKTGRSLQQRFCMSLQSICFAENGKQAYPLICLEFWKLF